MSAKPDEPDTFSDDYDESVEPLIEGEPGHPAVWIALSFMAWIIFVGVTAFGPQVRRVGHVALNWWLPLTIPRAPFSPSQSWAGVYSPNSRIGFDYRGPLMRVGTPDGSFDVFKPKDVPLFCRSQVCRVEMLYDQSGKNSLLFGLDHEVSANGNSDGTDFGMTIGSGSTHYDHQRWDDLDERRRLAMPSVQIAPMIVPPPMPPVFKLLLILPRQP